MKSPARPKAPAIHVLDLGIILLLALIAAIPLWGPGLVNTRGGGDSPFLLQRTLDMAENLRYGTIPVRWMSHAAYDLGYPFFNHYAALPYYLSGGLTVLGVPPLIAIQATQTLGLILSALTMALWAYRIHKHRFGVLVSVAAYVFAPFHLVNLYVRGDSLSEFYAFVWYPLILWTIDQLADRPAAEHRQFRLIVAVSLAYSALILTHNVSLLIFSPFALLYALLRLRPRALTMKAWMDTLLIAVAPFILGMLITAWFWVPALVEVRYGQLGTTFTEGYFHYSRHFRGLNLIQPRLAFDYRVPSSTKEAGAFATGLVQAGFALLGSVLIVLRIVKGRSSDQEFAPRPVTASMLILGLLVATLMITPLSRLLWTHLPLLETTQFPWRFLSIQALYTAILTGSIVPPAGRQSEQSGRSEIVRGIVTAVISVIVVLSAMLNLHPDRLHIDEDVTWDTLLLYETFTGNIGTTIRYEYLPADIVPRLYISESVIDGMGAVKVDGDATVEAVQLRRTPTLRRWHLDLDDGPVRVVFPLNAWPGWWASVDGERTQVAPVEGSGRLSLTLPSGEHDVTLRLGATPVRGGASAISLLAWLATLAGLLHKQRFAPAAIAQPSHAQPHRLVAFLILGTFLSIGLPAAFHGDPDMRMAVFDFEEMPYPHAGPIDYGPITLTEVTSIPQAIQPGDRLDVPLRFNVNPGITMTGTLRLVSPAEPRHNVPYRLAETSFSLGCGMDRREALALESDGACEVVLTSQLDAPDDLSRGLYLIQLILEDSHGERFGHTARDRSMGRLYVGAVSVREGPPLPEGIPVLGEFDELTLHDTVVTQPKPTAVHLTLTWSTSGTPRNWSYSVRLLDLEGRLIAQHDQQPGYGYLPTSLWHADETITDQIFLDIPEGLAPGRYTLRVITYLRATMTGGGEFDVPIELQRPTLYDLREACCEQTRKGRTILCQAAGIALIAAKRPDVITQGDDLTLSAEWNAIDIPNADITVRWGLSARDGTDVAEVESPLAPGSEPSTWPRHTWVQRAVKLPLPPQIKPGDYELHIMMAAGSEVLATCTLPQRLTVTERPRVFSVPNLPSRQDAQFGNEIQLLGYELPSTRGQERKDRKLLLTLWWRALTAPGKDYKRFVHLYDPQAETIAAQDDAMPQAWTYPTSWWASGEVVSETVTLDVNDVSPGMYRVAVGWYDPETIDRLPALDASGTRQPGDRVVLDTLTLR